MIRHLQKGGGFFSLSVTYQSAPCLNECPKGCMLGSFTDETSMQAKEKQPGCMYIQGCKSRKLPNGIRA